MNNKLAAVFRITIIHICFTIIVAYIFRHFEMILASDSVIAGGVIMALDFFVLGLVWCLVFSKKYIALAVTVSVIKFAILGIILYVLFGRGADGIFHPLYFILGCSLFILTAMYEAIRSAHVAPGKC